MTCPVEVPYGLRVVWQPPPEPAPAGPSRPRRRLVVAGVAVAGVGLVCAVAFGVRVAMQIGSPMAETLSNPVLSTPFSRSITLSQREYAVFELTDGAGSEAGDGPTLEAQDVRVTGPNGEAVRTEDPGWRFESLDRGADTYTAAVYFSAPEPGRYRVTVDNGEQLSVVVAPSLESGFSQIGRSAAATAAGVLGFIAGMVMLIVGLVRRQARPVAALPGTWSTALLAAPGWYPDPQVPQQWRYWTGQQWAPGGPATLQQRALPTGSAPAATAEPAVATRPWFSAGQPSGTGQPFNTGQRSTSGQPSSTGPSEPTAPQPSGSPEPPAFPTPPN